MSADIRGHYKHHLKDEEEDKDQSSGAVWMSRWMSWAPVSNKYTVSVDVKQSSLISLVVSVEVKIPSLISLVVSVEVKIPSLISLEVSVDVKHHVYLLTSSNTSTADRAGTN